MKKIFTFAIVALLSMSAAHAQEAFKHLGASIEFGTTGLGVNFSYPIITDRLIVTAGYNFPSLSIGSDYTLNSAAISDQMGKAVGKIEEFNRYIDKNPEAANYMGLDKIPTSNLQKSVDKVNTDIKAKLNFGMFKAFVEYYPTKESFFHFTAGILIDNGEWMDIRGKADASVWAAYKDVVKAHDQLQAIVSSHPELKGEVSTLPSVNQAAKVTVRNETFAVDPESGELDVILETRKIKPYLGIGFGSSVPTKKRLGFQMELGLYYQGKPTLESSAKVDYDANAYSSKTVNDIVESLQYLNWYPQLTFRFTGRIF